MGCLQAVELDDVPSKQYFESNSIEFKGDDLRDEITYRWRARQEQLCGIYCFYDRNEIPLYLGVSGDLRTRIRGHLSGNSSPTNKLLQLIKSVKVLPISQFNGSFNLFTVETNLIKEIKPLFNGAGGYKSTVKNYYGFNNLRDFFNELPSNEDDEVVTEILKKAISDFDYLAPITNKEDLKIEEERAEMDSVDYIKAIKKAIKIVVKHGEEEEVDEILDGLLHILEKK